MRMGLETLRATLSERRQAMFLGAVSQNSNRNVVTPKVAAKTESPGFDIKLNASTVAKAAAAVLTRLLPKSTVARKRSGRWTM